MNDLKRKEDVLIPAATLEQFVADALSAVGVAAAEATSVAQVMIAASVRGVDSHGIALLSWYLNDLEREKVNLRNEARVTFETGSMLVIDAGNSLGAPVATMAMERCIEKARTAGIACATVNHANHFGMAAAYAMQALPHNMIGMAMTNASRLVAPTFGVEPMLGTNPIAMAAPAGRELPFVLDMATSVMPFGKTVMADKRGELLPQGVAIDSDNQPLQDPAAFIHAARATFGAALLPLGSDPTLSSYKGYGLAMLVDILSGVLSGAGFGKSVSEDPDRPSDVGHWFMAMNISSFMEVGEFQARMDTLISQLKGSRRAAGQPRIYVPGEIEFETEVRRKQEGIPVDGHTVSQLEAIAERYGLDWGY